MPRLRPHLLSPAAVLFAILALAACGASPASPSASTAGGAPGSAAPGSATPADSSAPESTSAPASTASPAADLATSCNSPATPTIAQTEGPYYKPGAPESADLVTDGMAGTRLTLTGLVVTPDCTPVAGATVEIWQADSTGAYDNSGYTLRGWVTTDADGRFTIHTIVPGEYPGRTEHIHVKVTPSGGTTLTTQLYFPGTTANDSDGIYDPSLLLAITEDGDALVGTYTFVIAA